jgi:acyl CoA:acetate/3-ketoacid CoA transferase
LLSGIISEEGLSRDVVSVVESGPWGGVALTGPDFGISMGAFALSTIPDMFSNYEGGIIDTASLGFLQVDQKGNVNPSYIPGKLTGPGGFPVIAEGTPRVYFAGTFTAGKSDITVENGKLNIRSDGEVLKFVNRVYKIFFSGKQAMKFTKEVRYFTERAIFTLTGNGLRLDEVAPGVDLDRDILGRMEFRPMVSRELKEIPPVVLSGNRMNLKYMITHH